MALSGWDTTKIRKITIDGSKIEEDLANFPVFVHVTSSGGQTGYDSTSVLDELAYQLTSTETNVNDIFTGADEDQLNGSLWSNTSSVVRIRNNKLNHTSSSSQDVSSSVRSLFLLDGDFDIQIDYDITTMTQPSSSVQYVGFRLFDSANTSWRIGRIYSSSGDQQYYVEGGGTPTSWSGVATTDTFGKQRFVRIGSTLKTYFWTNSQWEWNGSTSGYTWSDCPSGAVRVILYTKQESNASLNVNIDNFTVNTGTIVWPQALHTFTGANYSTSEVFDFSGTVTPYIYNNTATASGAGYGLTSSKFRVKGDFDVQVDWSASGLLSLNTASTELGIWDQYSDDTFYITRQNWTGGDTYIFKTRIGGTWTDRNSVATSDTSGRFRLVRSGTIAYAYYWSDGGWNLLGNYDMGSNGVSRIELAHGSWDTNPAFVCTHDNFILDTATILWPIGTFPNRKKIAFAPRLDYELVEETVNDDFSGTTDDPPRSDLWWIVSGSPTIQNNRLYQTSQSAAINSLASYYWVDNDFDIQIDYDITTQPTSNYWITLMVFDGSVRFDTSRRRQSGVEAYESRRYDGSWTSHGTIATTDTKGSLRVTRVGDLFTSYKWNGSSWDSVGSYSFTAMADSVQIRTEVYGETDQVEVLFNNYYKTSGNITWIGTPVTKQTHNMYKDKQLYCEIADWDIINNSAEFWVSCPALVSGTNTELLMYYDSTHAANDSTDGLVIGFTGADYTKPDSSMWDYFVTEAYHDVRILNNKLNYSSCNRTWAASYLSIRSRIAMSGDFDVQLDFDNLYSASEVNGLGVEVVVQRVDTVNLDRCYLKVGYDGGNMFATDHRISGTYQGYQSTSRTNDYGKLRIIRSGSNLSCQYQDGTGSWQTLYNWSSAFTQAAHIVIGLYSPTSGGVFNVNIDNITVSGSQTSYIGDVGTFISSRVWDDNYVGVYHLTQDPEVVNTSILDSTINNYDGSVIGSLSKTTSTLGSVTNFPGTSYINIGTQDPLALGGGQLTSEVVFSHPYDTNPWPEADNYLWAKGSDVTSNSYGMAFTDNYYGAFLLIYNGGGQWPSLSLSAADMINNQYHYEASQFINASSARVIWDWTDTYSEATSKNLASSTQNLLIGSTTRSEPYDYDFQGLMKEVRFSKTIRSDAWMKATMSTSMDNFVTYSLPILFTFSNIYPTVKDYGLTSALRAIVTVSGEEPSYKYDTEFYLSSGSVGTISGTDAGTQVSKTVSTPSGINYSWYMIVTSSGYSATSDTYNFDNAFLCQGYTEEFGTRVSGVPIRLYRRDTGELIGTAITSTASGTFSIETTYNGTHYAVALHDLQIRNALIADWLEVI